MSMAINSARIRAERLRRAWSQEQLAFVAGLGLRTVHRIEKGGRGSLESLKSLASVFELLPEDLMAGEDDAEPRTGSVMRNEGKTPFDSDLPAGKPDLHFVETIHALFRSTRKYLSGGIFGAFLTSFSFMLADSVAASQVTLDLKGSFNEELAQGVYKQNTIDASLLSEDGEEAVLEIEGLFKIILNSEIVEDNTVMIHSEVFVWEDEKYVLVSEPSLQVMNSSEASIKLGANDNQMLELAVRPVIR